MMYVQHLLGIGHVKRAALISRAMSEAGLSVTMVLGGSETAGVDFGPARQVRLPPLKASDEHFTALVDENGAPVDESYRERRRRILLDAFAAIRPDVLLIELFPFGRWQFRFELFPLLEAAHRVQPRPRIVASVRDVLVHKPRPERNREKMAVARDRFDIVLVHGDPGIVRLEDSFPEAAEVLDRICYTGFVADLTCSRSPSSAGTDEVIVSVGGGAVGERLLRTALAARPLTRLANIRWRLLTGPHTEGTLHSELVSAAPAGVTVERARPDFPILLRNCRLSISQGGYNTLLDIVGARARAIVVPFSAAGETEQAFRARLFESRGLVSVLPEARLSPETLAEMADRIANIPGPPETTIALDGARETARLVAGLTGQTTGNAP